MRYLDDDTNLPSLTISSDGVNGPIEFYRDHDNNGLGIGTWDNIASYNTYNTYTLGYGNSDTVEGTNVPIQLEAAQSELTLQLPLYVEASQNRIKELEEKVTQLEAERIQLEAERMSLNTSEEDIEKLRKLGN